MKRLIILLLLLATPALATDVGNWNGAPIGASGGVSWWKGTPIGTGGIASWNGAGAGAAASCTIGSGSNWIFSTHSDVTNLAAGAWVYQAVLLPSATSICKVEIEQVAASGHKISAAICTNSDCSTGCTAADAQSSGEGSWQAVTWATPVNSSGTIYICWTPVDLSTNFYQGYYEASTYFGEETINCSLQAGKDCSVKIWYMQ